MSAVTGRIQRWLIVAHFALAALYGALIPPYEAHDETGHFANIHHIVSEGRLPDNTAKDKALLDQSHQPLLYYLITSGLTFWIDQSDYRPPPRNVFAFDGSNRRGVRMLLRQETEAFPWHGAVAALHAARLVSAVLSTLMIALIARAATLCFPKSPTSAALATAVAALNPQVIFMGAMVNNDVMAGLTGAALGYGLLRLAHGGARNAIFAGVALGLSLASKNSALALIGCAGVALLWLAWRGRWSLGTLCSLGAILFASAALLAAPHFASNIARFGSWLPDREAAPKLLTQSGLFGAGVDVGLRDGWLPAIFVNAFRTFWGTFGWGNVQQPELAYVAYFGLCVAALIGGVPAWRASETAQRTRLGALALLGVSMLLLPGYRAIAYQDPALLPGRYLMPALLAYAILLAHGLGHWLRATRPGMALIALLGTNAGLIPFAELLPAYAARLDAADGRPAQLTFDDVLAITSVDGRTVYLPDREGMRQYARVKLGLRALNQSDTAYALGVTILGRDSEPLGQINSYPQGGNYPSTVWTAGQQFSDEVDVLIEKPCAQLPALGRVRVTLFAIDDAAKVRESLGATDATGKPVEPILGRFKVDAPTTPAPVWWQEPRARFAGVIGLRAVQAPAAARAGATINMRVDYELLAPIARDATVFVHALDAQGALVAQDDHAPFGGDYPASLWDAGECAREGFALKIPPGFSGPLTFYTGWYDATGRLAATTAFDAKTPRYKDDIVDIARVEVVR